MFERVRVIGKSRGETLPVRMCKETWKNYLVFNQTDVFNSRTWTVGQAVPPLLYYMLTSLQRHESAVKIILYSVLCHRFMRLGNISPSCAEKYCWKHKKFVSQELEIWP